MAKTIEELEAIFEEQAREIKALQAEIALLAEHGSKLQFHAERLEALEVAPVETDPRIAQVCKHLLQMRINGASIPLPDDLMELIGV